MLHGEIKSPPLSAGARLDAGVLLRRLQRGDRLGIPNARPMPSVAPRCHELRVTDLAATWRVVFRIDVDAIVILAAFSKKTPQTPLAVIEQCRRRSKEYDDA